MERVAGIEPAYSAWKADVLPLNYTRDLLPTYATVKWRKGYRSVFWPINPRANPNGSAPSDPIQAEAHSSNPLTNEVFPTVP